MTRAGSTASPSTWTGRSKMKRAADARTRRQPRRPVVTHMFHGSRQRRVGRCGGCFGEDTGRHGHVGSPKLRRERGRTHVPHESNVRAESARRPVNGLKGYSTAHTYPRVRSSNLLFFDRLRFAALHELRTTHHGHK